MFPRSRAWIGAYPKCMMKIDAVNNTYSLHFARDATDELRLLGCCAKWTHIWSGQSCHTGDGRLLGSIVHNNTGIIVRLHNDSHHLQLHDSIDHMWLVYGHVGNPERSVARLRGMLRNARYMLFGNGRGGTFGDPDVVSQYTKRRRLGHTQTFGLVGDYTIDDIAVLFAAANTTVIDAPPHDEEQIDRD